MSRRRAVVIALGALILVCICLALASPPKATPSATPANPTAAPQAASATNTPKAAPTPTSAPIGKTRAGPARLGQPAASDPLQLTAITAQFDDGTQMSKGLSYLTIKPDPGTRFLLVTVSVRNVASGDTQTAVSMLDFSLAGSENVVYGYVMTASPAMQEVRGVLRPGGILTGTIPFMVREQDKDLIMEYRPLLRPSAYFDVMP